jgi:predicted DNA-binding transcriptional regulator YafY
LKERRELKFHYRNLGAARAQRRQVRPYHLACVDNHWYLFAFDVKRDDVRTFALTRLRAPEITQGRFAAPKSFNVNEYLRGSFNVFKGGDDYEVVVDFDAWAADLVRGRRWHSSQELTELPKGMLRVKLRLNSLEEVERWILSMGGHGTVIKPDALRLRLARVGRELVAKYGEAAARDGG